MAARPGVTFSPGSKRSLAVHLNAASSAKAVFAGRDHPVLGLEGNIYQVLVGFVATEGTIPGSTVDQDQAYVAGPGLLYAGRDLPGQELEPVGSV
jgi:hypothetical protein